MNQLSFLFPSLQTAASFVRTDPWRFSGGSDGIAMPTNKPFFVPAFDRIIGLAVLALVVGVPTLPFLGR